MACCAVAGQGAGVAAALSVKADCGMEEVDMTLLQRQIEAQGVRIY